MSSLLKTNTETIQNLINQINALPTTGAGENEDAMVAKTLGNYFNDRVETVGSYAFACCNTLSSVNFPIVKMINEHAFYNCSSLATISFPSAKIIGSNAFYGCSNLTTIDFPMTSQIAGGAFQQCYKLTTVNLPVVAAIGNDMFRDCSNLTTVSFPRARYIYGSAFYNCVNLTTAIFPMTSSIYSFVFGRCFNLTAISFPSLRTMNSYAFYCCSKLSEARFTKLSYIGSSAFQSCYNLQSLYLTGSVLCGLSNSNAFNSTPYKGYSTSFNGTPHIYVLSSYLSKYKTATNWAYFSSYFVALESLKSNDENLINFIIEGILCQAEKDMTWEEWINSDYNNIGVVISTTSSWGGPMLDGFDVLTKEQAFISKTKKIEENAEYYTWIV